jgi:hypothetical protein
MTVNLLYFYSQMMSRRNPLDVDTLINHRLSSFVHIEINLNCLDSLSARSANEPYIFVRGTHPTGLSDLFLSGRSLLWT